MTPTRAGIEAAFAVARSTGFSNVDIEFDIDADCPTEVNVWRKR